MKRLRGASADAQLGFFSISLIAQFSDLSQALGIGWGPGGNLGGTGSGNNMVAVKDAFGSGTHGPNPLQRHATWLGMYED